MALLSCSNTFAGDARIHSAFVQKARNEIVPRLDAPDFAAQLSHAHDVARILRTNFVQGERVDGAHDVYRKPDSTLVFLANSFRFEIFYIILFNEGREYIATVGYHR